ncbi:hypothetical protein LAZ67_3001475 [Cordylochernes scorpioides]|uniref:Integrase catalytic domain-containing protein n=1 Tax=Cordylochernes scorpioides TaxID=51811 RepID=A0ABY6K736_9ARAC|nr:hypothetical protein LAZ67_3001475 [Cordylochernes scorpioides]
MVRRWRSWFLEGRQNVHGDERSGSPVTATDNAAVAAVRNVVEADRRVTIDEIMIRLPPGIEIEFSQTRAFLEMHQRDGDQLFSRIVTEYESWVHHSTPETKRQSMVWKKPEESAPKKAKVTISAGKIMAMENFKWEIFTHPPYSPELAPSEFHLYPALKWHLVGKHFANDDEVQAVANHWLRRQDTAWYNSDNGRQLVSGEFEQFTKMNGIRHTKTSPYNPSTNGLAERYVREFKNLLRKNNGKDDLETNLQRFLFAHRAFPQTVIKEFPRGTANEEKFKIKILEFNTKMGNPREVFHEAVRRQEQFTTGCEVYFRNYATGPKWKKEVTSGNKEETASVHIPSCTPRPGPVAVHVPSCTPKPEPAAVQVPVRSPRPQRARKPPD